MSYRQLTREQRYQIYALQKERHAHKQIAANLGVHPSTISRELRRNRGQRGYRPKQADELARARQHSRVTPRITAQTWHLVETWLRQEWSPEQISGWLKAQRQLRVSHERLYQHVYADKRAGGTLYQHLRCRKQRRKRYGSYDRRGQLPQRASIDARPTVVNRKERLGDWGADTIIGLNRQGVIVSLTERKSKLCLLRKVARNTAEAVEQAISALLQPLVAQVHTITSDNGREFARH